MTLSAAQLQVFADDLVANTDQTIIDALVAGANNVILEWYNTSSSPDFWVFKSRVDGKDLKEAIDWAEILTGSPVSAAERWALDMIMWPSETGGRWFNPTLENNRDGLVEIFGGQPNTRDAILNISVRLATRIERLFAVTATGPAGGDGSDKAQSADAVIEGPIDIQDVRDAVALIP
jgi:hypothetical protein